MPAVKKPVASKPTPMPAVKKPVASKPSPMPEVKKPVASKPVHKQVLSKSISKPSKNQENKNPGMIVIETDIIDIIPIESESIDGADDSLPIDGDLKDFDDSSPAAEFDEDDDF